MIVPVAEHAVVATAAGRDGPVEEHDDRAVYTGRPDVDVRHERRCRCSTRSAGSRATARPRASRKIAWPCALVVTCRHLELPRGMDAPVPVDTGGADTDADESERRTARRAMRSLASHPTPFLVRGRPSSGPTRPPARPDCSRAITSRQNAAATTPSTTRWSNVTETFPIGRTTISPLANDRTLRDAVQAEDRDLGMVDERRHEEPAELPGARDGERRVAELVRGELPARAPSASRWTSASISSTVSAVAGADDRDDEAVVRLHRDAEVDRGRAARSRRPRGARSAPGTRAATRRPRRSRAATSRARSTAVKSHSSTNVTAGTSRCVRVTCSTIARRMPRTGSRRPSAGRPRLARRPPRSAPPARCPGARAGRPRAPSRAAGPRASRARRPLGSVGTTATSGSAPATRLRLLPSRRRAGAARPPRRSRRAPRRRARPRPPRRGSSGPSRHGATGSRRSSCPSAPRRAAGPRRRARPPRRASARSPPRSGPRPGRAA